MGFDIARYVFPDYWTPGGRGHYLVPLMGGLGAVLSFSIAWYIGIRIFRVFRPRELEEDGAFHQ